MTSMEWATATKRSFLAPSSRQTPVLGRQVRVLRVTGRPGYLHQRCSQPLIALGGAAALALAPTLVVARRHAHPGAQMTGRRKLLHVGADLCQDVLRGTLGDPRHFHEPR